MKRSDINRAYRQASAFFAKCGWVLPPEPRWDITDVGLGDYWKCGLALVSLCEEPEMIFLLIFLRPIWMIRGE